MSQILTIGKLDALSKVNLTRLALVALFITLLDTIQSYYGQRVVNAFTEFNAIPAIYYAHGLEGYVLYAPIEFGAVFLTVATLWVWASYVLWYHRNVLSKLTWSRNS
ncbi:MAG: hypothetical protein ACYC7D_05715 [Nitrososphaerales archaeon]